MDSENKKAKSEVFNKCQKCGRAYKSSGILKHIAQSESCNINYTEKELLDLKYQTKKRIQERKRKLYDPCKRQKKHRKSYDPVKRQEEHLVFYD